MTKTTRRSTTITIYGHNYIRRSGNALDIDLLAGGDAGPSASLFFFISFFDSEHADGERRGAATDPAPWRRTGASDGTAPLPPEERHGPRRVF